MLQEALHPYLKRADCELQQNLFSGIKTDIGKRQRYGLVGKGINYEYKYKRIRIIQQKTYQLE